MGSTKCMPENARIENAGLEMQKQRAAVASADYVRNGMRVGLGTGSTVKYLIDELGARCRKGLSIQCAGTSIETEEHARRLGIPVMDLRELGELDIAIDGADQFDEQKNLVKGGHGALLREKIVAAAAAVFVVIADSSKHATKLDMPVPVEFLPLALLVVQRLLEKLHGDAILRKKQPATGDLFTTELGNHIFDLSVGPIVDPATLGDRISRIPGVVCHGLFCGMAQEIVVGHSDKVEVIR